MVRGISWAEKQVVYSLYVLAEIDTELSRTVAEFPWLTDSVTLERTRVVYDLSMLAEIDTELSRTVLEYPWLVDGVNGGEKQVIGDLRGLADVDVALARTVGEFPWLTDDVSPMELSVVLDLRNLADIDVALARTVAEFQWLADDVSKDEDWATAPLPWLAEIDVAVARVVVELPWLADGVTGEESRVVWDLGSIAEVDVAVARAVVGMTSLADGMYGIVSGMKGSMRRLSELGLLDELAESPWYADGLNDADLALLTTLGSVGRTIPTLYDDFVRSYYVKSKTISLPLAGEVRLWALDPSPFPEGEDTLRMMEEVVRASEAFMGVPFPVTDAIMVVPSFSRHGTGGGYHAGSHLVSARDGSNRLSRSLVYHEVGHYYFTADPFWLSEGGANLIVAITRDELGVESIEQRRRHARREMERICHADNDIRNIQQLNKLQARLTTGRHHCNYVMGEHFLIMMTLTLGEQASSAALREIYLMGRSEGGGVTEEEIYRAFLKHTPTELESEFRALYKRLHGGTYDDEEGN